MKAKRERGLIMEEQEAVVNLSTIKDRLEAIGTI